MKKIKIKIKINKKSMLRQMKIVFSDDDVVNEEDYDGDDEVWDGDEDYVNEEDYDGDDEVWDGDVDYVNEEDDDGEDDWDGDEDYVNEEDDDGEDEVWDGDEDDFDDDYDISGIVDGHDFMACYGRDAWDKLFQDRLDRHRNILLRLLSQRLPNLSEQEKNGFFHAFSHSEAFGVLEHNALLDALAHPVEGLSLFKYDQL
ncbi:hypothetical protein RhiirA1_389294 [Rhizophagus irregularis]|uniref:Uncharacterized protein n=3 Tax=Rhizophagus irregularis TaxID=588596 RepID=A0A2N0SBU2_9GLOM|nr:hypothetical protein RhiirA1_389294 [Rhizophagus irregularis]